MAHDNITRSPSAKDMECNSPQGRYLARLCSGIVRSPIEDVEGQALQARKLLQLFCVLEYLKPTEAFGDELK